MKNRAAFVGLSTWDLIYVVDRLPATDEKITAADAAMNAGGPATNAAVTFSHLGGEALLVTKTGAGPIGNAIREELQSLGVALLDLAPLPDLCPPVSSAFITRGSACRALVSLNGTGIPQGSRWNPAEVLSGCGLLLVDGHYMEVALEAAAWAKAVSVPVVLDGGSWKPGTESLLRFCDAVISSSRFLPPGCATRQDVLDYLWSKGIGRIAITDGERPITVRDSPQLVSIPACHSRGVDTTGAGDVFHGAFCFYHLSGLDFRASLAEAAKIAARKCDHLGARSWMDY